MSAGGRVQVLYVLYVHLRSRDACVPKQALQVDKVAAVLEIVLAEESPKRVKGGIEAFDT